MKERPRLWYAYNTGKKHGIAGTCGNPYKKRSPAYEDYELGYADGQEQKPPTIEEVVGVIDKGIDWCHKNPSDRLSTGYQEGFVKGLIQAKYLIGEMAKAVGREPEHGDLSEF